MIRVMKYLSKHWVTVLFIIALLVLQAACDLALPQYTSDIVDTGIQQEGIDTTIPNTIRKTTLERLSLFLDEEGQKTVSQAYSRVDTEKEETVYELTATEEEQTVLEGVLKEPVMLVAFLSTDSQELTELKETLTAGMGNVNPDEVDLFTLLSQMPMEQRAELTGKITEQFKALPELIAKQASIEFVKTEYRAQGMDLSRIQYQYLLTAGLKMIGIALLGMVAAVFICLLAAKVAAKIGMDLRSRLFKKVVSFSNSEMDRFSTASLITRNTNDIQQIQLVSVLMLRLVFYAPIMGIGGIIKVLTTESTMTWIIFVAVAVIMLIVGILLIVAMPKFRKMQVLIDRLNLVTREILTGLPVIRAFSTERHEERRFDQANEDLTKNLLFTNRTMAFMMPVMMFIMNGITLVIVWFGAKGIELGNLQVGDMMAFMTYTLQIVISFLMLTIISIMLPRAAVSARRIDEVLDTKPVIQDPVSGQTDPGRGNGEVVFDHVYFRYPNAEDDALEDITFTAKPGRITAFIGSTGSGKTTLINLIPRLYDVTGGSVCIDGRDVREFTQHALREKLGYVPQKGVLFSGTIESNIRYGAQTASADEMKKAAEIAQAADFIEEKPEGYKSEISQGGSNVSGGQKQRLSIARAIAKRPEVYIFDDSFSALDYKTDVALRKALKEQMSESTVLIVAQRISTIMQADQIIVLDEGKIAGIGTHQELLAGNEVYQQIASSQLSSEELSKNSAGKEGGNSNE